ncbi:MAG: flagellar biosynthetic protein FliO [Gammaproteobacteria bacterium RBG_16_57_12]|nr:MAG: flagellar biosynthetic protein FliO [Gammaproteobacteria bacterium RBG_16_57_12]
MASCTVLAISQLPAIAMAADQAATTKAPAGNLSYTGMITMTLGLVVVLGMIFGVAWLFRRLGQHHGVASGSLKALAGLPLGARERLVLIQVGDKQILLGVTPNTVQTLHVLENNIKPADVRHAFNKQGSFAERLAGLIGKGN